MKEISENSKLSVSVKPLIAIAICISTIVGMWYALQSDIEEAKNPPEPIKSDVSRVEFDMKDKMISNTILNTQDDITEIKEDIKRIEDKIDELR